MATSGNHPTAPIEIEDEDKVTVVDLTVDDLEITMKGLSYRRDALLNIRYRQPEQSQPLVPASSLPTGSTSVPIGLPPLDSLSLGPEMPATDTTMAANEPPVDDSQHGLSGEDGGASHTSRHEDVLGDAASVVMTTNAGMANFTGAQSTSPSKLGRMALTRRSKGARSSILPTTKRWTYARPEDILLFQLKKQRRLWGKVATEWNETTGHCRTQRTLEHRWHQLRKSIGEPPQGLLVEYDYARASHALTHQEPRGVHATLTPMTTNTRMANHAESRSTLPVNMTGIVSTRWSQELLYPKQWTDAGPEDILLTQFKELGASRSEITAKWNEVTGRCDTERGLDVRRTRILRSIGQPPQHLIDKVVKSFWCQGVSGMSESNGESGSSGASESNDGSGSSGPSETSGDSGSSIAHETSRLLDWPYCFVGIVGC